MGDGGSPESPQEQDEEQGEGWRKAAAGQECGGGGEELRVERWTGHLHIRGQQTLVAGH